ncbi:hypothetical protein [Nocardioides antri]|uniref:EfeO-type cupredoxin-like domain-containing protein n=1 Tax=Nocardioides antri TaxID=2607659 RepID=A0A5B1LYP2_9ACTN|nr:hypothetical protein [Nocardioides antri]KAA1425691.1 hypothetical protein F0U47_18070 [Nocardioides antri]
MGRTAARAIAVTLLAGAALSACSTDEGSDDGNGGGDPVVVEITFEGGEVTPNGDRVEVGAGEPIDLVVTADEPGTIHLHSTPEQEFSYEEGTETFEIQIDRPGVVEVESHELDQVIVQLEVR